MGVLLALILLIVAFGLIAGFLLNHWLLLLVIVVAFVAVPRIRGKK